VLAAGGYELITRGRRRRVTTLEVVHDDQQRRMPPLIRPFLRFMRVTEFLRLTEPSPQD
jgi:hypothetical protein